MGARFDVHVVPGVRRPGPDGRHGGLPRLRVAAKPEDGKANAEVVRTLTRLLNCEVALVGGTTARKKLVEADLAPDVLEQRLEAVFGPQVD